MTASSGPAPALPHRRLHAFARRWLNPAVLRLGIAGARHSPIALVRHIGRRSGRSYATPLAVHRGDGCVYVPLTYGPNARWCLNVMEAGRCTVRLDGRELQAYDPRVLSLDELPPGLRRFYRLVPIGAFLRLTVDRGATG